MEEENMYVVEKILKKVNDSLFREPLSKTERKNLCILLDGKDIRELRIIHGNHFRIYFQFMIC